MNSDATIFTIPAVEAVITFKWNAFARRALFLQLACYLVWLLGFTGFTWNFQVGGREGVGDGRVGEWVCGGADVWVSVPVCGCVGVGAWVHDLVRC